MARVLLVHPGPDFSVADVYRGWEKALKKLGHTVMTYNTNDLGRLTFYGHARMPKPEEPPCETCGEQPTRQAVPSNQGITTLGMDGLYKTCYVFWPDVVFFISAFYMTPAMLQVMRTRRHKIVMLHTESPYQDDEQMSRGQFADLNLLNDPANLGRWRDELEVPAAYMPHAYDPDVHYPAEPRAYDADFKFIGTLFKSRAEFFSRMDFTGLTAAFGGSGWDVAMGEYPELVTKVVDAEHGYRLVDYLGHPLDACVDNSETADAYRTAKVGINFYRREGENGDPVQGWAMGPREVEMAACGLFFLRDPRPESDEVFGRCLPAFGSADEASQELRYWAANDPLREKYAALARERIAARTFDSNARAALTLMEEAGVF
jgi:spore maturation protein CgeB